MWSIIKERDWEKLKSKEDENSVEDERMHSASNSNNEKEIAMIIDSLTTLYFKLKNHELDP